MSKDPIEGKIGKIYIPDQQVSTSCCDYYFLGLATCLGILGSEK